MTYRHHRSSASTNGAHDLAEGRDSSSSRHAQSPSPSSSTSSTSTSSWWNQSIIILFLAIITTMLDQSLVHVIATPADPLQVIGGQGSRSWSRLIESATKAYTIITPGVLIELDEFAQNLEVAELSTAPSQLARNWLASNSVDFTTSDSAQSAADSVITPDMVSVPLAAQALVIVYNINGVTELTLSMAITARIFLGNITRWDDPSIAALNPSVPLPAANITLVVRTDLGTSNTVFNAGLTNISPIWKSRVATAKGAIQWPYTSNMIQRGNIFSQGAVLSTTLNTISYMWLDEANDLGLSYANFMSTSGDVIVPDSDSVLFAIMEKDAPITSSGGLIDLTIPAAAAAWPLSSYAYLVLRTTAFRSTCTIKTAAVAFWYWFYTSTTAATIASTLNFVIPPSQILTAHGVIDLLNSNMFCEDELVLPAVRTESSLGVGTELARHLFDLYPPVYSSLASDITGDILFRTTDSDDALQRLMWGEVDFAITIAGTMRPQVLQDAIDQDSVMILPLYAMRYTLIYNIPGFTSDDVPIVLNFEVMSDIWRGVITTWDDARIAALNPAFSASGRLPAVNITRVVATTGARDVEKLFQMALNYWTKDTDFFYNTTLDKYHAIEPYMASPYVNVSGINVQFVTDESKIQSCVDNIPGAIGIVLVSDDLEATTLRASIQRNDGQVVADDVAATYKCMPDSFNETDFRFKLVESEQSGCWPFSSFVYTMVRKASTNTECTNLPRALEFLQFLHDQSSAAANAAQDVVIVLTDITDTSNGVTNTIGDAETAEIGRTSEVAEGLGSLWATPAVRAVVQDRLNEVTCDGDTILVTLPVDHRITTDIESATLAITILGSAAIFLVLCFIYFFHLRSAIKASSPVFLIGTVIGLLMLFISGTLLTRSDPTNASCEGGWWMGNLGFFMTFGPLFLKTWRIYKIFMRKEMTVVKLTDMNLMVRLAFALAFELLMLGIMQGISPFAATEVVQYALPRDQTIYYCAPNSLGMAIVLGGYKAIMLLFGALMSFSTRSVSENFNESKPIAVSIYNVIFTCCIIIPIALLNQSDGRTIYLLAIFAVYWITICTFVIVFAPKVITIYKDASGFIAHRISDSKASASELASRSAQMGKTIKELSQQPVRLMDRVTLRTYVVLLEKELITARAALATLDANENMLAIGTGGRDAAQFGGKNNNVSNMSTAGGGGAPNAAATGTTTGGASGGPNPGLINTATVNGIAARNNNGMISPTATMNGRSLPGVVNGSPKGGPQITGNIRDIPGLPRSGSVVYNKYTIGSSTNNGNNNNNNNGGGSSPVHGSRHTASVAPAPSSPFTFLPSTTNVNPTPSIVSLPVTANGTATVGISRPPSSQAAPIMDGKSSHGNSSIPPSPSMTGSGLLTVAATTAPLSTTNTTVIDVTPTEDASSSSGNELVVNRRGTVMPTTVNGSEARFRFPASSHSNNNAGGVMPVSPPMTYQSIAMGGTNSAATTTTGGIGGSGVTAVRTGGHGVTATSRHSLHGPLQLTASAATTTHQAAATIAAAPSSSPTSAMDQPMVVNGAIRNNSSDDVTATLLSS